MGNRSTQSASRSARLLSVAVRAALAELLKAYEFAEDAGVDLWQFSIELEQLAQFGLTVSDARWLAAKGFVRHAEENTRSSAAERSFQEKDGLTFASRSVVVLSASGATFARELASDLDVEIAESPNDTDSLETSVLVVAKPIWIPGQRELMVDGRVVKRFKVPAVNQELILSAFEEEGWPQCIFDPLPQDNTLAPARRMHNAISRLNGKQINVLVRFSGNGHGTGICWELLPRKNDG